MKQKTTEMLTRGRRRTLLRPSTPWDPPAKALKKNSAVNHRPCQTLARTLQLALATGSEPLRPANHALRATVLDDFFKLGDVMYARFKQEKRH